MSRSCRTSRGFTLMEVLATLVLIGVVLPVAMRGISMSLQAAASARHRLEAAQLAQQKIAEMLVLRDARLFNGYGDFGDAWPAYRWRSEGAMAGYGVYRVSVTVTWMQRDVEQSLIVDTLVYPTTGLDDIDTEPTDEEVTT